MKVIIAGSRIVDNMWTIEAAIRDAKFKITEVVSGGAKGADRLGESWARLHNIPIKRFDPDWSKGKSAGIVRNVEMAKYAQALIACWDCSSAGTQHMINEARKRGLQVYVYRVY